MRLRSIAATLVLILALAANAQAQCSGKAKAGDGVSGKQTAGGATCHKDKSACPMAGSQAGQAKDVATGDMPIMRYKVGDQTTCCAQHASELAGGNEEKIHFIVADKEYAQRTEALSAYAVVLEKYLETTQALRYAVGDKAVNDASAAEALAKEAGQPVQYRVASVTFADRQKAEAAAESARAAAQKVQMTYTADGKTYTCPKEAEQACQKTGAKYEYTIGECRTNCPITARVELAKARITAANKAAEQAAGA